MKKSNILILAVKIVLISFVATCIAVAIYDTIKNF